MKPIYTIHHMAFAIHAHDEHGNIVCQKNTSYHPAALRQLVLWCETRGSIDWDNSPVAKPDWAE